MSAPTLVVLEPEERRLSQFIREAGIQVDGYAPLHGAPQPAFASPPTVIVADLRGESTLPGSLAGLRSRYPNSGVLIVTSAADPKLLLEAMRAGITECVPEPFSADDLRAGIERLTGSRLAAAETSRVLAFVGAKGGVGTTTLAVNAAMSVAGRDPGNVAVVDLHLGGHGDVALLLGLEPRFSVADALENTERLDNAYLKTLVSRTKGGLDVLASPERPLSRPPEAARVRTLLRRLSERYATVVLDVPRDGFGLLDSLDPLSSVTLVVNQELPTVRRAAQLGEQLRQRYGKERVGAVVNRYDPRADIGRDDIERVVDLPVWATLPSDYRKVLAAANAGRPFVSENHSRLAASIDELGRLLGPRSSESTTSKPAKPTRRLGFF